eukprot:CAMPEP_0172382072 /NCGR_PEP_ID=MMETSP1061-20121228/56_1 /TAXON_ID=37318 /ORGANISM="Pseudo-nitzschia pungens, Strain cf. pungens" /LENGTH=484 /DNA_ID=CAMNT_0013109879 /DNA_START=46 /DNA_END=1500 /DNA_ORIENTATION=-
MRHISTRSAAFYVLIAAGVASGDTSFSLSDFNGCRGTKHTLDTQLNFGDCTLKRNDLKDGGELRFGNIGQVRGNFVDLVVTASDYEIGYDTPGLEGKFGQIGLSTKQDEPSSGSGVFEFCLVEPETNNPVTADSFQWTIFDMDRRKNSAGKRGIHERMFMDLSQVSNFFMYPNEYESQIKQSCEDGQPIPCDAGVRTIFEATQDGTKHDNPSDPNILTELQMKRSITFTFMATSCWTLVYDAYCPFELETPKQHCSWYGGSNFFFAGQQDQMNDIGKCITSAPTVAPVPTPEPSEEPTEGTTSLEPTEPSTDPDQPVRSPCAEEIELVAMIGIPSYLGGGLNIQDAVHVISSDGSTVTVNLIEAWDSTSIDTYYYEYQTSLFDRKCFSKEAAELLGKGNPIQMISMNCSVLSKSAMLKICLRGETGEVVDANENASVPTCCESIVPEGTPTVCYTLAIDCSCDPEPMNELNSIELRNLRNSAKN